MSADVLYSNSEASYHILFSKFLLVCDLWLLPYGEERQRNTNSLAPDNRAL
jgi:hypothetical protein